MDTQSKGEDDALDPSNNERTWLQSQFSCIKHSVAVSVLHTMEPTDDDCVLLSEITP